MTATATPDHPVQSVASTLFDATREGRVHCTHCTLCGAARPESGPGATFQFFPTMWFCDACCDKAERMTPDEEATEVKASAIRKDRQGRWERLAGGEGSAYLDNVPDWFPAKAWAELQAWNPRLHRGNLVIFGPKNTCKTRMALERIREEMLSDRPPLHAYRINAGTLRKIARDQYDSDSKTAVAARRQLRWCETVGLLLIDGLDGEFLTEGVLDCVTQLFDVRKESRRPILITSSWAPKELAEILTIPKDQPGGDRMRALGDYLCFGAAHIFAGAPRAPKSCWDYNQKCAEARAARKPVPPPPGVLNSKPQELTSHHDQALF